MESLSWPTTGDSIYVGGEWVRLADAERIPSINPTDETTVGYIPAAGESDVDRAVAEIKPALASWRATSAIERARYLREFSRAILEYAEELIELEILDSGLPRKTAERDVKVIAANWPAFYASMATEIKGTTFATNDGGMAYTEREPFGIVGRIVPFNHPIFFAVQAASVALIAGNVVIIKPPEQCSLSTLALAEVAGKVFPPGVFNVITGFGHGAGNAIVAHPDIPRIGFTGSVPTGRRIYESGAAGIKRVTLELGGKNPFIVTADADPDRAAQYAIQGMNFAQAGQSCQSTTRLFVHDAIYDDVVQRIAKGLGDLVVDDPAKATTDVGPLAFRQHYERVLGFIESGKAEGATLCAGGRRPEGREKGYFIEPTLFSDVTPEMRVAREEIFGPVFCAMPWQDEDEVIEVANDTNFGLVSRVLAGSMEEGLRLSRRLNVGTSWVNSTAPRPSGMPYIGFKQSGLGVQDCLEEVLSYTQEKSFIVGR